MDELEIYGSRMGHRSLNGGSGYTRASKMVGAEKSRKKYAVARTPSVAMKALYVMIRQSYQSILLTSQTVVAGWLGTFSPPPCL